MQIVKEISEYLISKGQMVKGEHNVCPDVSIHFSVFRKMCYISLLTHFAEFNGYRVQRNVKAKKEDSMKVETVESHQVEESVDPEVRGE